MVPMRDGIKLATNVYLPKSYTKPLPTLLIRTPYSKDAFWIGSRGFYDNALLQALQFPVVVQDVRGRYNSEGKFYAHANESTDGYDTMEWILDQDWNNGQIVTMGWSSLGMAQYAQTISEAPGLKAQFISVAPANLYDAAYLGGAYRQGLWEIWFDYIQYTDYIPTMRQQEIYSDYWDNNNMHQKWNRVKAPAVFLAGWYDLFLEGTIDGFNGYQTLSDSSVQGKSYIVVGPWSHGVGSIDSFSQFCCGQIDFPENSHNHEADIFIDMAINLFLEQTMGTGNLDEFDPINFYVMGPDEEGARGNFWARGNMWPKYQENLLYLHDNSTLNSNLPTSGEKSKSYIYDPLNPVSTLGGNHLFFPAGPNNVVEIDNRADTLVFETNSLSEDLLITGETIAKLFVKSNATDTDFVVRVSDVYNDLKSILIQDGIVRMKWRNGNVNPEFMNSNEIYEIDVKLTPTSYIFNKGHKIRVAITSSNYPAFSINKNDGSFVNTTDDLSTAVFANNTIYQDADHPSRLILPEVSLDEIFPYRVETTISSDISTTTSESSNDESKLMVANYLTIIMIFVLVRRRNLPI
jgi:predicted acyl esterase